MRRRLKKKLNNAGNTFILILVTVAVMGILIGTILATMAYFYRTRMLDLNNKKNFYYVETAMNEIYEGVGSRALASLMSAYQQTVEVMVVYDVNSKRYVTIDEDKANKLMKQKFLSNLADDSAGTAKYIPSDSSLLYDLLSSFITVDGVTLVDSATPGLYMEIVKDANNQYDQLVIHNITVKRTTDDGYIQSITSDIVISDPGFNVSFSNVSSETSAFYKYAVISDMGLEFVKQTGSASNERITIAGNIYAASDYYNKSYNGDPTVAASSVPTRVNNYDSTKLADCIGLTEESRYSGIYAKGVDLNIIADSVIVPGSISIMDGSKINISGDNSWLVSGSTTSYTKLYADNIVLAPGYEQKIGDVAGGGQLHMYADAYIADDLEVNSEDAVVELAGNYYGYNYSQVSSESLRALSGYVQASRNGYDSSATYKNHYNSSAIIINGKNAKFNISELKDIYVAGRAYISTSSVRRTTPVPVEGGTPTTQMTSYDAYETNVDIQTGESISIKSNQLAYIVQGYDTNGKPIFTNVHTALNDDIYNKIKQWLDIENPDPVTNGPVIEETIAGRTYCFLKFKDENSSKEFFKWYTDPTNGLKSLTGYAQATDLIDVTDYAGFTIAEFEPDPGSTISTSGTYSYTSTDGDGKKLNATDSAFDGTNFAAKAKEYNENYLEYRYMLRDVNSASTDTTELSLYNDIKQMDGSEITPLNNDQYLNFKLVWDYKRDVSTPSNSTDMQAQQIGNSFVWISDHDVVITNPTDGDGNPIDASGRISGLVITPGDVTIDSSITRFDGMIICGGKIKAGHSVAISSNSEVIKTILRTAEATKNSEYTDATPDSTRRKNGDYSCICKFFTDYEPDDANGEDTARVGDIQVGDILRYANWKKNVE